MLDLQHICFDLPGPVHCRTTYCRPEINHLEVLLCPEIPLHYTQEDTFL